MSLVLCIQLCNQTTTKKQNFTITQAVPLFTFSANTVTHIRQAATIFSFPLNLFFDETIFDLIYWLSIMVQSYLIAFAFPWCTYITFKKIKTIFSSYTTISKHYLLLRQYYTITMFPFLCNFILFFFLACFLFYALLVFLFFTIQQNQKNSISIICHICKCIT